MQIRQQQQQQQQVECCCCCCMKQFINDVIKAEICTSIAPDHKGIFLSLKIKTTLHGDQMKTICN